MLTMVFLLGAAIGLSLASERWPWSIPATVLLAAWAMTRLPDIDLLVGLGHRSGLTNSLLPAGLACGRRRWWPLAAGAALGLGFHLSADMFPNAMRGYATVKLPGLGSIGGGASYLWLAANAVAALILGAWLLGRVLAPRAALAVLGAIALLGIAYLFATDGGWWALAMIGGTGWLALRGRRAAQPG
jgi:hypothetical protein